MQISDVNPTSAQRLITVIQSLAEFDVVQSTEEDQLAVQEAVALTSPEHQQALLIALLLERVRA
ncbi:hypothetical protein JF66_09955 [Cryobacterium sp. MLB-32]|uniref:hypothetical protein n=1 Tax=Cryobacterium sp. MLB-32 TaxID=1529318 RepID=UPI0004E74783|nr:hypothetical protein [Cryobacterium sp. MLB-32]KFF59650.1 hypothetical protein JF66_09955 [Cryobacterium sp. MLB-32]